MGAEVAPERLRRAAVRDRFGRVADRIRFVKDRFQDTHHKGPWPGLLRLDHRRGRGHREVPLRVQAARLRRARPEGIPVGDDGGEGADEQEGIRRAPSGPDERRGVSPLLQFGLLRLLQEEEGRGEAPPGRRLALREEAGEDHLQGRDREDRFRSRHG